jgi:2-succinyl-6-hydroxy-2,4-cyclohexadiene-1-carboxylate synthase
VLHEEKNIFNAQLSTVQEDMIDKRVPTLLFLHGFLGCKEDWSAIVGRLQGAYQILTLDLPGHGEALFDDPSSYEMENCAASIIELLSKLAVKSVHLIGYSMGGRVALYLAVHYPEFFRKVLLISASPGIEDEQERRERIETDSALAEHLENDNFAIFLENWYSAKIFASLQEQPKLLETIISKRKNNSTKHLALSLRHMGTGQQSSLWQALTSLKVPIDLVVGALDPKFVSIAEKMLPYNPAQMRLHKIKNSGHAVHLENERALGELITTWSDCSELQLSQEQSELVVQNAPCSSTY